jgi:two-component system response regulator VicR
MAKKILIADDARESRTLMRLFLEQEKYEVSEVSNGKDAMIQIAKIKPDLVILDLVMPIMDGLSVAIELGKNAGTKDIPVIISTSHDKLLDLISVSESTKIKDCIEKPFKPENLVEKVKKIIN